MKIVENQFLKKVRKNEKQITLVEKQANIIKTLISKALSGNEISESEFEKILPEIEKYRKKDARSEKPAPTQSLNTEFDKMITDTVFSEKEKACESHV